MLIVSALYRPFTNYPLYSEKLFVDVLTRYYHLPMLFGPDWTNSNSVIVFSPRETMGLLAHLLHHAAWA